uniref:Uncharacterized protein n=1 Tax=Rhizophora mucronata TaxID=61149 RepID=A0A2P2QJY2_RHIMU
MIQFGFKFLYSILLSFMRIVLPTYLQFTPFSQSN